MENVNVDVSEKEIMLGIQMKMIWTQIMKI